MAMTSEQRNLVLENSLNGKVSNQFLFLQIYLLPSHRLTKFTGIETKTEDLDRITLNLNNEFSIAPHGPTKPSP